MGHIGTTTLVGSGHHHTGDDILTGMLLHGGILQIAREVQVVNQRVVSALVHYASLRGTDVVYPAVTDMHGCATATVEIEHGKGGAGRCRRLVAKGFGQTLVGVCQCTRQQLVGQRLVTRGVLKEIVRQGLAYGGRCHFAMLMASHAVAYYVQTVLTTGSSRLGEYAVFLIAACALFVYVGRLNK